MRKLVAVTQMTLDGVMQALGGPEEDPSGGFDLGGWSVGYFDDALRQRSQAARETFRSSGPDREAGRWSRWRFRSTSPTCGPCSENAQRGLQHGPCRDR
jgi:hypothetical protein